MCRTIFPELACRELLPRNRGQTLGQCAACHHQAGRCVVHREWGVEHLLLVKYQTLKQGIHGKQKPKTY